MGTWGRGQTLIRPVPFNLLPSIYWPPAAVAVALTGWNLAFCPSTGVALSDQVDRDEAAVHLRLTDVSNILGKMSMRKWGNLDFYYFKILTVKWANIPLNIGLVIMICRALAVHI